MRLGPSRLHALRVCRRALLRINATLRLRYDDDVGCAMEAIRGSLACACGWRAVHSLARRLPDARGRWRVLQVANPAEGHRAPGQRATSGGPVFHAVCLVSAIECFGSLGSVCSTCTYTHAQDRRSRVCEQRLHLERRHDD